MPKKDLCIVARKLGLKGELKNMRMEKIIGMINEITGLTE